MKPVENRGGDSEAVQEAPGRSGTKGSSSRTRPAPTRPGRRGKYWVKLKEELDTLDVVIVGAELGHGKRAGSDLGLHLRRPRRTRTSG